MHTHELTLGLAFGLGALHALEPGHGKTAMLVYLSGERKSLFHPMVMGISSAISHSVSLIAIAAMVHLTHHLISGDHNHSDQFAAGTMQWISASLVIVVGLWMGVSAWRAKPAKCGCGAHHEPCEDNVAKKSISTRSSYTMSALLGVAFGLLPCPSALAAYFTSMSTGSPFAAYAVIGLFAAGIASSLTIVGIFVQLFGDRVKLGSRVSNLPWPWIRSGLITLLGVFYLAKTAFLH